MLIILDGTEASPVTCSTPALIVLCHQGKSQCQSLSENFQQLTFCQVNK